jgi:putative ABC transport system substrate-binding protein
MFMLILAINAFCASSAGGAEAPGRIPRIGMLLPGGPRSSNVDAFLQGLHDLGYVEGQNIIIDSRFAEWKLDQLPGLAEELVRMRPDVIFTYTTPGVLAAKQATKIIPVVVAPAGGLVERGVIASLARPGGNITGLTLLDIELEPKRLQILKEAVQKVSRVAILVNPANPAWNHYPASFAPAAHNLGLRLLRVEAREPAEFAGALSTAVKDRADALLMVTDAMFSTNQKLIVELAGKRRLPSISGRLGFAVDGGLIQYGPSTFDMARRAASYVDKILKGAKPGDLPVEQPTKFELVINLKTAKALGLTIPQSVLVRADEVIQ